MVRLFGIMKMMGWVLLASTITVAVGVGISNKWIVDSVQSQMYNNIEDLPVNEVGLVLGTSKYVIGGDANPYFYSRMKAAADLYHAGKIKHIIVSGDNRHKSYNEPREMHNTLVRLKVPHEAITLDFAGFRTFDSVIRCKEVFQQPNVTIVSQEYHNTRALFISNHSGLNAVAYNADNSIVGIPEGYQGIKTREYFARSKAILDLFVMGTKPRFLGTKVKLDI